MSSRLAVLDTGRHQLIQGSSEARQ